jgi:sialic acid synthase SpsE
MIDLYANISIGHENDWAQIEARIIAAAQCNADALVMSKSTPHLNIPEHKKYVSINSKWGSLPYIDVAKRSELDELTVRKFNKLTEQIGIPVIWSITDSEAGAWVKENTDADIVKAHFDSADDEETLRFCAENFNEFICPGHNEELVDIIIQKYYKNLTHREKFSLYHTTQKFPPTIEELNLDKIEQLKTKKCNVGYEARCEDIFPDCAVVFKNVNFIEKFLGEDEEFNTAVLTPKKFYDFFVNMNQLEIANG